MKNEDLINALRHEIESNKLGLVADLIAHLSSKGDEDLDLYRYLTKATEIEYELLIDVIRVTREKGIYMFNGLVCE
ncbi:hypothetical protein R7D97_25550 [Vibrio sp. Vb5031]|uniref:Uncharacterized protein n=4 Tax=Vibrionaceae TaxID=641 RepID=A0A1B1LRZ3_VIBPH|nr:MULTISPECIES: hypothetical protein [Vibrio]UUM00263.1 hypothetical protein [Vibrio alginolyticus]ANS55797.1 hypothetical protein [Vibrio parahaemolyticus]EJL6492323.1 hypothetical protein [Vibrio cholerae]EJL6644137.1 hypothetical protein [Vibrio cholerae]KOO05217.1 hypothetical protein AKJ31_21530 [Vibrio hepatarius]